MIFKINPANNYPYVGWETKTREYRLGLMPLQFKAKFRSIKWNPFICIRKCKMWRQIGSDVFKCITVQYSQKRILFISYEWQGKEEVF